MNKHKKACILLFLSMLLLLVGCDDDKVVMITTETSEETLEETESTAGEIAAVNIEETTTEYVTTEEATAEEKNITLNQIYEANRGDVLLKDGVTGYSINTVYYSQGTEVYSEFEYIGFDDNGIYMQVYEDSEGYVEVLDTSNMCWYIVDYNQVYTLIYPEEGTANLAVNYTHNEMVMSDPESGNESIQNVYRQDGKLVVETKGQSEFDEEYIYSYILDEEYKILECRCYEGEELISYSRTNQNAVYNEPEIIAEVKATTEKRLITVQFPDGSGIENIYTVPREYPVKLKIFNSKAYSDSECLNEWVEVSPMSNGFYADENIYMIKNLE